MHHVVICSSYYWIPWILTEICETLLMIIFFLPLSQHLLQASYLIIIINKQSLQMFTFFNVVEIVQVMGEGQYYIKSILLPNYSTYFVDCTNVSTTPWFKDVLWEFGGREGEWKGQSCALFQWSNWIEIWVLQESRPTLIGIESPIWSPQRR